MNLGKLTNDTSKIHFIASYHRYIHALSKHTNRVTRSAFPHGLFLAMQNTGKPVQKLWDHCRWVCDSCGDFGIWLKLGVPLNVFSLTGLLLLPLTPPT